MKRLLSIGIIFLFIGLSISCSTGLNTEQSVQQLSSGDTLYVGGSGTGNYTRIQDAINDSNDGDTVYVFNGTYYEYNIIIQKQITLTGQNKYNTIINGNYSGIIIFIESDRVNINELTIKNGIVGTCIASNNFSNISNNIITNNERFGIYCSDSYNNIISKNNVIDNLQKGILIAHSSDNIIYKNEIIDNGWRGSALMGDKLGIELSFRSNNNKVYYNNISNNYNLGINITGSFNNYIEQNNFIKNNNYNAIFVNSFFNRWLGNYWDDWIGFGPIFIFGRLGRFRIIPWFNIDWHPAQEPYDIEV